jgi:hypothetical protein
VVRFWVVVFWVVRFWVVGFGRVHKTSPLDTPSHTGLYSRNVVSLRRKMHNSVDKSTRPAVHRLLSIPAKASSMIRGDDEWIVIRRSLWGHNNTPCGRPASRAASLSGGQRLGRPISALRVYIWCFFLNYY